MRTYVQSVDAAQQRNIRICEMQLHERRRRPGSALKICGRMRFARESMLSMVC